MDNPMPRCVGRLPFYIARKLASNINFASVDCFAKTYTGTCQWRVQGKGKWGLREKCGVHYTHFRYSKTRENPILARGSPILDLLSCYEQSTKVYLS